MKTKADLPLTVKAAQSALQSFLEGIEDPERKKRLLAMQWRIDQELDRCKDPTQRYNKMVELFWEGVGKFRDTLGGK